MELQKVIPLHASASRRPCAWVQRAHGSPAGPVRSAPVKAGGRIRLAALALALALPLRAGAQDGQVGIGLSAELPLATLFDYRAEPRAGSSATPFAQSGFHAGPLLEPDDFGVQVPFALAISAPLSDLEGLTMGARVGLGSMCLDGPSWGEQGKGFNLLAEPFALYAFGARDASGARVGIRPYVQGGPLYARSCVGNTVDQDITDHWGAHLGGGTYFDMTPWLSLYGELRLLAGFGSHQFLSHGETAERSDGRDLRGRLLLGVTFWL